MAKKTLPSPSDLSLITRQSSPLLPNSGIQASVQNLAEALRQELVAKTAIERVAIEDYIQIECQRHSLRLIRDLIERYHAQVQVWALLTREMIQQSPDQNPDTTSLEREAELLVKRWINGDADAYREIQLHGIDIDEAISVGIFENLPQLVEFERQRDRLAQRARLLLEDIDRTRNFQRKRKTSEIQDAEIVD